MKLKIKTLQQQEFTIDVELTDTVGQVKSLIEKEKSHSVDSQKLICSGKILEDDKSLESYNITEKDFLVLVISKPKAKAPAAVESPQPTTPAPTNPTPTQGPTTAPAQATNTPAAAASALVVGSEFENMVNNIVEMGFEKDQVMRALRAAFNNPDRAVEYLTSGNIPNVDTAQAPRATPASTGGNPGGNPAPTPTAGNLFQQAVPQQQQSQPAVPRTGTFDALRNLPQFNQFRQIVQQDPRLLQPLLEQLGQHDPRLYQLIQQNQQEFIQIMNEPVPAGTTASNLGGMGMPGMQGEGGAQYIQVTPEERAAIDRLESLGFERSTVIEAYFACEKDEQLAANYLLEHGFGFEDEDQPPHSG